MIAILGFLARLSVILGFVGIVFSSISDILFRTDYLGQLDSFIDLSSLNFKILVGLLSIIYLVVFLLSYINKLTKYSQNRKVKNKNGEIEVSIKTINETSKDFLNGQEIIKNSKVKSYPKGKSVVIEATVDTYNVDNLNEKLAEIQNKLSEYVFHSTGITVKKSKVKLKKVLGETIVEKKIIDSPTNQKENIKKIYFRMRMKDYNGMAELLNFSTEEDKAVFWSKSKEGASNYAKSIGGKIMEHTQGEQIFDNWDMLSKMYPEWSEGGVPQNEIWEAISKKYANEVTGVVKYYNPTDELGYIWENKEYPVLRERLKKDSIDGILYLNPDNVKKGGK